MKHVKMLPKIAMLAAVTAISVASAGALQTPRHQLPQKPSHAVRLAPKPHPHARKWAKRPRPAPRRIAAKPAIRRTPATAAAQLPAAAIRPTALPELLHGRDPFAALIRQSDPGASRLNLPPGIAGLQVATVQLQGMVKTDHGMVAVVANPQDRVYFLHDGDHIYDGMVERIGLNTITFRQQTTDAFGRVIDRNVTKRLYPIAGDEQ